MGHFFLLDFALIVLACAANRAKKKCPTDATSRRSRADGAFFSVLTVPVVVACADGVYCVRPYCTDCPCRTCSYVRVLIFLLLIYFRL